MRNLEQELKLQLNEREYNILSQQTQQKPSLQINYYFTSEHFPKETMVRVREKDGTFLLCCKRRLLQNNGISVCDERDSAVEKTFAGSMIKRGIRFSEINSILKTDFEEDLQYAGRLDTYRTAFDLAEWHLELDKCTYLGKTDYELECECDNVQQLEKLKSFLVYNFGITIRYSLPKSQRFFETKKV